MPGLTLMVQGTGSHVGKSVLVTALCRILRQQGMRVAPFKSQNMSNNAHVCMDGGEIGRAQAVQAQACGVDATVDMNPVLLKPCSDTGSQVVVRGRVQGTMRAREYQAYKPSLLPVVREALDRLRQTYDVVLIEGAGSPAEINLRGTDIVNMRVAEMADAPVLLVGNIDLGGVFAQIVGTMQLLLPAERERVRAFVINKFRGDEEILKPGIEYLEREVGRRVLGVVPFLHELRIPSEDSVSLQEPRAASREGTVRIDVVQHPRIANFTDFESLANEPDVSLRYVERPDGSVPDALILPGTKSTIADLRELKLRGFVNQIGRCLDAGGTVVGICGGFQMLGAELLDPEHVESQVESAEGLGLLDIRTVFGREKETARVRATHLESGATLDAYEIHMGCTQGNPSPTPLFRITERFGVAAEGHDGAASHGGRVWGTYLHGLFDSARFRRWFVEGLRARRGLPAFECQAQPSAQEDIDALATAVREHLDMQLLDRILRREA